MELTNKALALILVVATAVSLVGTILTINSLSDVQPDRVIIGRALTDTGVTNFTINSSLSVVFTIDAVEFGTGQVNQSGSHTCSLNTTGNNGIPNIHCTGFNNTVPSLLIQNQGTVNVTLNISVNADNSTFVQGDSPSPPLFWFRLTNEEANSCFGSDLNQTYQFVAPSGGNLTASEQQVVCENSAFDWNVGQRTLNLTVGIRIPQNSPPGTRTATFTATASS